MLELFYMPGMYEAILAILSSFASGHTKGIVMDSGVLMSVRSTCPPRSRRSWLSCLCLLWDTRRGFVKDTYDVVSHTVWQDHLSVKHFRVEGQLVFLRVVVVRATSRTPRPVCDQAEAATASSCTSDVFYSWTTVMSSFQSGGILSRASWVWRIFPLYRRGHCDQVTVEVL